PPSWSLGGAHPGASAPRPQLLPDGTYGWPDPEDTAGHGMPDVAPPAGSGRPAFPDLSAPPPRRRSRGRWIAAVVVVLLVAGGAGAAFGIPQVGVWLGLRPSPRELATKAGTGFLSDWQSGNYAGMQARLVDKRDDMNRVYGGMAQRLHITKMTVTPGVLDKVGTTLPYTATATLKDLGDISWSSNVHLVEQPAGWKVQFTSDTVYPGLANGQRLDLASAVTNRGNLLDRNGKPLSDDQDLAVNVLGSTKNGVGASGLQRTFNDQLGGRPTTKLVITNVALNQAVQVLKQWSAEPGKDVATTFDLNTQRAAEQALNGVNGRAALVAIDVRTGEVRAMASHPTSGLPAAFASYYAPGSTFKIITATAALLNGATPDSATQCTQTLNVNGHAFKNAEKAPDSTPSLLQAFAESCNTAFIRLSQGLPAGALQKAAQLYGFNAGQPLSIASVGGQFPTPTGAVEAAADAIGQGKVEASPLQMASVAAGVASGTWRQPRLVPDCPTCASHPIPVASSLQPLMRAVVTSGTGTLAGSAPGGPVYGKTGTAEFGNANPPQTHAWFVGWQGNTAFAVFVEEGAFGGTVAAPIAAQFLRTIGGG
ncbi:MAG TPA: penicillin-binding transpeptidase domain-containing protein, partial [Kineosporiaceae bacterium]|nr:penicillin-binding transpeptidase domain-containing protein [Kineosporiaceae bacterium]